jgi:acetylornithine deacetylase
MTPPSSADILHATQARAAWMQARLMALVAAESFSGHEETAQALMEQWLAEQGFTITRVPVDATALARHPKLGWLTSPAVTGLSGCHNLFASRLGANAGQGHSLLVSGHVDVVPTGAHSLWTAPPFAPRVEGDWLYGRGAADMKGGLVAALTGIAVLDDLGVRLAAPLYFNTVVEEECTGNGALACAAWLHDNQVSVDCVLDPEPFGETIMASQVGVIWGQVELTGRPAHVLAAGSGVNAIDAAMHLWSALKRLEADFNARPAHPAFANVTHPLNFNIGKISGGEWASSVPIACRFDFRCGFYPDVDPAAVKREVEETIHAALARLPEAPQCVIRFEGFHAPGCVIDTTAPPFAALRRHHQALHGVIPVDAALTGTTDVRQFLLGLGIPSTCYGPIGERIHALDERVSLASMQRVAATYAAFIADWCSVAN